MSWAVVLILTVCLAACGSGDGATTGAATTQNSPAAVLAMKAKKATKSSYSETGIAAIYANGSSSYDVTVSEATPLSIKIGLAPGTNSGRSADWWVFAETPDAWYSYVYPTGWVKDFLPAYTGAMFDFPSFEVLNSALPAGDYTFYFAVDTIPDGYFDSDASELAFVDVHITASGGTGGPSETTGQIAIWTNSQYGVDSVYLDNSYVGTLDSYYSSGTPTCGDSGTITRTVTAGTHTVSASNSSTGTTWSEKNVTVTPGGCLTYILSDTDSGTTTPQVCKRNEVCDICGIQKDSDGNPVSGATVSIVVNGSKYTATSDATGKYNLILPANVTGYLPDSFSYSVYKAGYVPITLIGQLNTTICDKATPLVAANSTYVVFEIEPLTHHLGNSSYSGSANSQFQYPNAEGTSWSKSFTLSTQPSQYLYGTLTFMAKGLQKSDNGFTINSSSYTIDTSSPDGSYTIYELRIPSSVYRANQSNTLTIKAGGSGSNIDDIEFQNVVIQFGN